MTDAARSLELTVDADGLGRRRQLAWQHERRRDLLLQLLLPFTVIGPLLVGWELYARGLDNPFVPGPTDVLRALPEVLTAEVLEAFVVTNVAMIQGYLAAGVIGILVGLATGRFRRVDAIVRPYLDLAMVTPMIVLMPIVLMALGLTTVALSVVVFLFALPYIAVPTRAGARGIPDLLIDMGRSFGGREMALWREVILPGALPFVLTGLRLGFGQAVTGIIATELTLLAVGIGRLIISFQGRFQADSTFAVTLLVVAECVVVMGALRVLELRQRYRAAS
jgi:ABC-type nitrate/sulfonate/bicarbonate transport system permease component